MQKEGFWYRVLSGVILGAGMIIPGVSGGVLAIVLGLYKPIIEIVADPLKNWRSNLQLVVPLGIGAVASVLALSNVLDYLFAYYPIPILYLFTGLVIGSIPAVVRVANKQGFRLRYIASFTFFLVVLFLFGRFGGGQVVELGGGLASSLFFGFLVSAGTVIPGLSSSFLLMVFGAYQPLLRAVARLDIWMLLPVALGFLPSTWLLSKLISWLFEHFYGWTYYAILGILIASVMAIFPGLPGTALEFVVSFALLLGGAYGALHLQRS